MDTWLFELFMQLYNRYPRTVINSTRRIFFASATTALLITGLIIWVTLATLWYTPLSLLPLTSWLVFVGMAMLLALILFINHKAWQGLNVLSFYANVWHRY